jgi:colanic acid/amylovoran biosynthesis glycosyltransferase
LAGVCHVVGRAGGFSEVWLDAQVCMAERHASSLLSIRAPQEPYLWQSHATALPRTSLRLRLFDALPQPAEVGRGVVPDLARAVLARAAAPSGRADLHHAHFGYVAAVWSAAAAHAGVPLVASFYGMDATARRFQRGGWRRRYGRLFRTVAAVLAEGPTMAGRLAALGCPAERIHVVRLPVVPPGVHLDDHPAEPVREYAACFGGRFVAKKGLDVALRAFARAFPHGPQRRLLVGAGPQEQALRGLVASLGLAERVDFRPPVPPGELARLFQRSHVAVFPSVTAPDGDCEGGAPLTIPLAQSVGVAAIVSDHDDLPWAAAPGTAVVPSGDVEALASALAALEQASRTESSELGRHLEDARAFVATAYDAVRLTRERERVYDTAIA